MLNGLAEIRRSSVLHLVDNEGTDLRGRVLLATSLNPGITVGVSNDLVGNVLDVLLDLGVLELSSN